MSVFDQIIGLLSALVLLSAAQLVITIRKR